MKFNSFSLKKSIVNALDKMGYNETTPVQSAVIPSALKRNSLVVQSETGSGKTHSFLIPIINNIDLKRNDVQSIIMSPTRELAKQTYDFAVQLASYIPGLKVKLVTSGTDRQKQEKSVGNSAHIFIGTPGRLNDLLIKDKLVEISQSAALVIDEADMMMEMGYFGDIDSIVTSVKEPQVMVFSATYPQKLKNDIEKYAEPEKIIQISGKAKTAITVMHYAIDRKHKDINEVVENFIKVKNPYLMLVFCSKKDEVNDLYHYLHDKGIKCGIIHGDLESRQRKSMMRRVKDGEFNVVVCSDIAARGIDIPDVSIVLNYDLPNETEYYFHRAGRTGRINKKGECYTLYNIDSLSKINKLESLGVSFKWMAYKNDEFVEDQGPDYRKNRQKPRTVTELDKEIKIATSKARTNKVKPNYKKKIRLAKEKVIRKHRREMIKKDIRRQQVERYKEGSKDVR